MKVEPTKDNQVIREVLCHPWIYERITQDHAPQPEDYEISHADTIYLAGYAPHLVGLVVYDRVSEILTECHMHALPEQSQFAHTFADACLKWLWANTPTRKLVAIIPEIYPDVIKFAQSKGMKAEGINQASYLKGGRVYNQIYMGLIHG